MRIQIIKYMIIILLVYGNTLTSYSQASETKRFDSTLIKNVLPNGLTYYIKHLPEAGDNITMQFFLNAGNRVETNEQPDVSHAIEHLAFRTTKNFPLGISNYSNLLKEAGMGGTGIDIQAFNGMRGTKYIFKTKPDSGGVDLGLLWFYDILGGLSLTDRDIDIERRTLIQEREGKMNMEARSKSNIEHKLYSKFFPCMNDLGESYIDKINNFDPDNLRQYYEDWYQPKNVAIAIVGNIPDVEGFQNEIKKRFSGFRNKKSAKNVPDCFSEYFSRPDQFEIIERKRDTTIHFANNNLEVKFFYRDSLIRSSEELEAAKRQILWEMANEVLEDHLQPLTQSYSSNFKLGVRNTFKYERKPAATSISIEAEPKDLEYSITEVFSKINELKTYGLPPDKWEKLKLNHLHNLGIINKIKIETPRLWIDDIERNFWQKEPLTPQKYSSLKAWMEQLELGDFNSFMNNYFGKVPRDIAIIKPEHSNLKFSENDFRSLVQRNLEKPVLVEKTFTPEHLLSEKEINKLKLKSISFLGENYKGSKEFLLQNGIRVVLLEDKNYKEKVSVWGFDSIGTANITNTNLYSVAKSPDIIKHAGIGNYNKFEVDRLLKSKNAEIQISPYIENKESGIKGQADLQNTELLFQMIYLYFTAPRKDKAAFKHWKRKELDIFLHPPSAHHPKDFQNSIKNYFGKSKGDFWGGTYHFIGTREASFEESFKAYQTIFSNFSNYTFIIRGGDEEALLPQIKKYLGNLNSQKVRNGKINHTVEKKEFPAGPQKVKLKPSEYYERDQVFYGINFTEKIESYDWKKHLMLKLLSALIWEMAMKFSSEEGIAAYYVYNGSEFDRNSSYFSSQLYFECFKDEVNAIQMASRELFKKIREGNIEQGSFDKALNRMIRLYGKNGIKHDREKDLYDYYRHGITSGTSDEKEKFLRNLNKKDLHKFAKSFLVEDHMFEFEM